MEIHINARGYTSPVGVQHGNTHSHKGIYNLCGIPAWKHTLTQEDIQALWESSGSPTWTHEGTPRRQKINAMNGAHLASPIRGELGYAHWPQLGTQFIALLGTKFGAH